MTGSGVDQMARWRPTIEAMRARISIGDFARMTHLSVKALRHYHDIGLLDPAEVDPQTGYRFYEPGQAMTAQVICRFRDLGMPLDDIRSLLDAPDVASRSKVIVAHLDRMEARLTETQEAVASLRSLLEQPRTPAVVTYRSVAAALTVSIAEYVRAAELSSWWDAAFAELYAALAAAGVGATGPAGALYPAEMFEEEAGEMVAFVPAAAIPASGRVRMREIPAAELAVAVHNGAYSDLDRTYADLGTHVSGREIGIAGPIREYYLVSPFDTPDVSSLVTEVCWPVFQTAASGAQPPLRPPW